MVSQATLWLAQFFFDRRIREPSGGALYAYRVSEEEFAELKVVLRTEGRNWRNPGSFKHWAGCYAIYIAESYRRNHDPEQGWTWEQFDRPLGLEILPTDKGEITLAGLKYWKRPVRRYERGNDYLGSLFAEGGLPWALLRSPVHGFGRAVRSGILHFYEDNESNRSVAGRMAEFQEYFPRSFRSEEVCLLLAGIVGQLIAIVEHCRLREGADPLETLDKEMQTWRSDFPIPLDDANAGQVISEWLREADRGRRDQERRLLDRPSTCAHRLTGDATSLREVVSIIEIQRQISFPIPALGLSSTRLELTCFESERLVQQVGVVYAECVDGQVRFKSPKARIEVRRSDVSLSLSLRVLDAGATVLAISLTGSAIVGSESPVTFELGGEGVWSYLASDSCNTRSERVRVRLPADWAIESGHGEVVATDESASWIEVSSNVTFTANEERVRIGFSEVDSCQYRLSGTVSLTATRPEQTYLGWPRILRDDSGSRAAQDVQHVVNGQRRALSGGLVCGAVQYRLCDTAGHTLFRQKFGLLPTDFKVRLIPRAGGRAARIIVATLEPLLITANVGAITLGTWEHSGDSAIDLPDSVNVGLAEVNLAVRSRGNPNAVVLRYPFPFIGVKVTDSDGKSVASGTLTLADLPGMEALLFGGTDSATTFRVVLTLIGEKGATPTQYSNIRVADEPVRLRLNSYAEDIASLFAASPNQDGQVRLSIESGIPHVAFQVARYKYRAMPAQQVGHIIVSETDHVTRESDVAVAAMCIPTPDASPLEFREDFSLDTGVYSVPKQLENDGPWIVFAPRESRIGFRPLFIRGNPERRTIDEVGPLGEAIRQFHPVNRPTLIAEQISEMGSDVNHPGWDYLRKLKDGYSHLPLSVFEFWKAVAGDARCLALAVLRADLPLDLCLRIQTELAVVWEAIPIGHWRDAVTAYTRWLTEIDLPPLLVKQLTENADRKIKALWPGLLHLGDYLQGGTLPNASPLLVLKHWHDDLRRDHHLDDRWPTQCGAELRRWVDSTELPASVKELAVQNHVSAVTYVPMFLAYVTAGRTSLELPGVSPAFLKHAVRYVANFDRIRWFAPVHALMTCHLARSN